MLNVTKIKTRDVTLIHTFVTKQRKRSVQQSLQIRKSIKSPKDYTVLNDERLDYFFQMELSSKNYTFEDHKIILNDYQNFGSPIASQR